jgi:hypothetical protein
MSQFGMQMPTGRAKRGASLDAITALVGLAVVCLVAACVVIGLAGSRVGKDGSVFGLQGKGPGEIKLKQVAGK